MLSCHPSKLFLYQLHETSWNDCTKCDNHMNRGQICYFRGTIPSTLLFIAESPDEASTVLGQPFPENTTDQLGDCINSIAPTCPWAITYLTSCPGELSSTCWQKCLQFMSIAEPKLICCLSKTVLQFYTNQMHTVVATLGYRPNVISVPSPIWILKQKDPNLEISKCRLSIAAAVGRLKS